MPKSRRQRVVALTQTAKKTRDHKASVIQEVRDAVDNYETLYLFSYENMRSSKFKNVRLHFREDSRIFLGKNKLLQIAMGKTPEEEYSDNLRHVSKLMSGSVGLLFTSKKADEVDSYFRELAEEDFARAGVECPKDVMISKEMIQTHPVNLVDQFRKLGIPCDIQNGRLVLVGDQQQFKLCKKGEILTPEQCKALMHFGIKLSEFRVTLLCRWKSQEGEFAKLN